VKYLENKFDTIVVGAGHAGCEAALAAANLGMKVLLCSLNLDNIALMPCNPAIGGPAKSTLVREIDALGGVMGEVADATYIQMKMLNSSKGPAVRALRAQTGIEGARGTTWVPEGLRRQAIGTLQAARAIRQRRRPVVPQSVRQYPAAPGTAPAGRAPTRGRRCAPVAARLRCAGPAPPGLSARSGSWKIRASLSVVSAGSSA